MPKLNGRFVSFSVVFACGSLGMVSACGKDDDDKKSSTGAPIAAFLKESDFSATKLSEVTETDLKGSVDSSVNSLDDLKRSIDTNEASSIDATTECLFGGVTYSVSNKSTITVSAKVDATACLQKSLASQTEAVKTNVIKFTARMFFQGTCDGADFSAVNGKKVTEAGTFGNIIDEQCANGTKETMVSNFEMDSESISTFEGKEQKQGSLFINAQMQSDGTPCIKTKTDNLWTWGDGCGFYSKSQTTAAETPDLVGTALITIVKFTGVKEVDDKTSPYYSEGKASIDINGWKGEAVFAGATQAPSWSLKKGDVTVTGVYAPPAEEKK
jgi:hypothetical protein